MKSPARSPTQMCSFIAVIKLTRILGFSLRTLVSCKKISSGLVIDGRRSTQRRIQGSSLVTLENGGNNISLLPSTRPSTSGWILSLTTVRPSPRPAILTNHPLLPKCARARSPYTRTEPTRYNPLSFGVSSTNYSCTFIDCSH